MAGSTLQEKVLDLFKDYDPQIRQIIAETLIVEQEHLSMKGARAAIEKIEEIVEKVAKHETR